MLLGSPPDMVRKPSLRKTGSSTLLTSVRQHIEYPGAGIHPCCSGLQVQGTADSPTSAAFSKATDGSLYMIFHDCARCRRVFYFVGSSGLSTPATLS